MGVYNSSKFMGPCWSHDKGYHHPAPIPTHIMRIITAPQPKAEPSKKQKPK